MKMNSRFFSMVLVSVFFGCIAQGKEDCANQVPPEVSDHCVRTFFCPPAKKLPENVTAIAMVQDTNLIGTLGVKKDGSFTSLPDNALTAAKQVYLADAKEASELTYTVSGNDVESDRCYFSYVAKGMKRSKPELIMTEKNDKIDLSIRTPKADEIALFGKTHKLCKKKECNEDADWGFTTVIAITDMNRNGDKEFWFSWVDGYRVWYKAEEYSVQKKKWMKIAEF